jgi:hypothetical protein
VRAHHPVVDAGAALHHLARLFAVAVREGHHGQRDAGLAVDRQRAGDRDEGQAQRLGHQAAGRFHLVGDDGVDAQRLDRGGQFAAQHVGAARHVEDHLAQAERAAGTGRAPQRGRQRAGRMGVAPTAWKPMRASLTKARHPAAAGSSRGGRAQPVRADSAASALTWL